MSSISAGTTLGTGLVSEGDTTGELVLKTNGGTTAVTIGTNQSATFAGAVSSTALTVNSNNISAENSLGFRNRIINGDMRIDQRNAGAAVTASGSYPVDRFLVINTTDGAFSAQQDSSAPAGFVNSIKYTTTTADGTLTTTQNSTVRQAIEGTNVADLAWGTANAKTVTLSFWVRSSLTGTFGGSIRNSDENRSYPFTYIISVADTWEYKTVTISGDTTGTWLTTNGTGVQVLFGLGAGPDRSGTAGAWAGASYVSATGATSVIGTLNATWYITGVQLEVGSVATPFERIDYGRQLIQCQRYCRTLDSASGTDRAMFSGVAYLNDLIICSYTFPTMRASPTATITNATSIDIVVGGTVSQSNNTLAISEFTSNSCQPAVNNSGTPFTQGHGAVVRFDGASVVFSAEL